MPKIIKHDYPVSQVRHYLEPGPIVLLSSFYQGQRNIMTMGWQTVMEFTPSLVGCIISSANHSFDLIRHSKECVINIPTVAMIDKVVGIGNCSGTDIDKFQEFGLTPQKASKVRAPLIAECFVNLECKLSDDCLVDKYNYFIFKVVKAHAAKTPRHPQTIHYRGDGEFMVAGKSMSRRRLFRPEML